MEDDAKRGCTRRVPPEAARKAPDADVFYLHPTEQSWDTRDDREVVCLALFSRPRSGALQ